MIEVSLVFFICMKSIIKNKSISFFNFTLQRHFYVRVSCCPFIHANLNQAQKVLQNKILLVTHSYKATTEPQIIDYSQLIKLHYVSAKRFATTVGPSRN